jgi:hypothetical protein
LVLLRSTVVANFVAFVAGFVDFVAGFGFVPSVAVSGLRRDGHKIRHKSTFGEFRPQNPRYSF